MKMRRVAAQRQMKWRQHWKPNWMILCNWIYAEVSLFEFFATTQDLNGRVFPITSKKGVYFANRIGGVMHYFARSEIDVFKILTKRMYTFLKKKSIKEGFSVICQRHKFCKTSLHNGAKFWTDFFLIVMMALGTKLQKERSEECIAWLS